MTQIMKIVSLAILTTASYFKFCDAVSVARRDNGTGAASLSLTDTVNSEFPAPITSRNEMGVLGVDVSTLTWVEDFRCLKLKGYQHAIVRAYRSLGGYNSTVSCSH